MTRVATEINTMRGEYMRVVNHGSNASTARPSTSGPVLWRGSVSPSNANTTLDLWLDTSS